MTTYCPWLTLSHMPFVHLGFGRKLPSSKQQCSKTTDGFHWGLLAIAATWAHRGTGCWEWQDYCQAAWYAPGSGLAVLKGTVKFPAGSLRPGAVMVISEESLAHNQCTLVRFLSSLLVSCSAFVNLGHFCFSSNWVSDTSCTQKCSIPLLLEHHQWTGRSQQAE